MHIRARAILLIATLHCASVGAAQTANPNCTFGFVPVATPGSIVTALETYDSGAGAQLYVGGAWSGLGGPPSDLLRWTGTAFAPVGALNIYGVRSLGVYDDGSGAKLYVGFTGAPGIRAWDGSSWSTLGAGIDLLAPAHAFDVAAVDVVAACNLGVGPELYVAGRFDIAGGVAVANLAKWNGSSWSALPSPGGVVRDMLAFDDGTGVRLYCATDAGLRIWNGVAWSATGLNSQSKRLCVYDSGAGPQLYASSRFGSPAPGFWDIGRWNGAGWSRTNMPYPEVDVHGVLESYDNGAGAKLYAVMDLWIGSPGRRLACFDGSSWSEIGSAPNAFSFPVRDLRSFDDGSGPALFVGGEFQNVFGQTHRFFAKYGCNGQLPPATFCTPTAPTALGCVPLIAASAHPSVTHASPSAISASGVDGQRSGLFVYGITGQSATVWCASSSNLLCVAPPRQRMTLLSSGGVAGSCNGALVQDWNAFQLASPGALGNPWSAGVAVDIQGWFRDPSACNGSSLTEGVRVFYQP